MLVFLLARHLVLGENVLEFELFLLAPYYVPVLMVWVVLLFLMRFPFFDTMPPLSPYIAMWVSYLVFLPACICAAIISAAREEETISGLEPELGLSPAELDLAEKRFNRRVRLSILPNHLRRSRCLRLVSCLLYSSETDLQSYLRPVQNPFAID